MKFTNSANRGARSHTHSPDVHIANPADEDLARRAQAGDRAAFEALVDRFLPRVRGFLYRLAGARGDPDDLAQDVFLIAVRALPTLREPKHISSWILGITYRVHQNHRRSAAENIRNNGADPSEMSSYHFPGQPMITEEERRLVAAAIDRLPQRLRAAFLLRHVEELAPPAIAKILDVPEGTARRWDFEARERLREMLSNRFVNDESGGAR